MDSDSTAEKLVFNSVGEKPTQQQRRWTPHLLGIQATEKIATRE